MIGPRAHRLPDGSYREPDGGTPATPWARRRGAWADADAGAAFGFRPLDCRSLAAGTSADALTLGRYVIAFNGGFNHRVLGRTRARDPILEFRSRSDTQVLLATIDGWGLDRALQRCAGMFAFALWDCSASFIECRTGWVSAYYGRMGVHTAFGSELKRCKHIRLAW